MSEEKIEIRMPDGVADGFVYRPAGSAAVPGVVFLTDIGGIREANKRLAARVADAGYAVLLPNVFYRTGQPPMWSFRPNFGEQRTLQRFGELGGPLNPEAIERDASAYVDFLAAQTGVRAGGMGVVGHCYTGGVALRMAAALPERIVAAASFHGGGLYTDAPTSPHLVLPRVRARLYFGHAIEDRSMSKEAIEKLEAALAAWGDKYQSETYEGAYHGWTSSDGQVWNEKQADRAFEKLTELFRQTLS